MLRTSSLKIALLAIIGLGFPSWLWGQSGSTTGSIVGRVRDTSGAAIAGASVVATQIETNIVRTAEAGEDGQYQFLQLPPGTYEVKVEVEGFAPNIQKVLLSLGTTGVVQLTVLPAGQVDVVEVKASETADEGKTESSTNIGNEGIDNLPINQRNFLDFALTAARVTPDSLPGQGVTATSGLSFNGQAPRFNNVTIDGLDNNDTSSGAVRSTFSQDAVREFQVVSDGYAAEFGRALGGIVNIVTKSGTNDIHGSTFFLVRNDTLSATEAFTGNVKPPYDQYQFGATVGGALVKNKAFYFGSFERLSIKQNNVVTISDATVRSINRIVAPIKNGPLPFSVGNTTILTRVDWQVSGNDSLAFRYNFAGSQNSAFEPFGATTAHTFAGTQRLNDSSFALSNTYSNGRLNLVNETRFLFGQRSQDITASSPDLPRVNLASVPGEGTVIAGPSNTLPQIRDTNTYQLVDNVSLSRNRHLIKFGIDFLRVSTDQRQPNNELGVGNFTPLTDLATRFGVSMASIPFSTLQALDPAIRTPEQIAFLNNLAKRLPQTSPFFGKDLTKLSFPNAFTQGFQSLDTLNVSQTFFSLFFQDDIKVRRDLLVKAGVRYDLFRTRYYPDTNGNFSPRVAIFYRPEKIPNFSIRAGYGIFFATPITAPVFISFPADRVTMSLGFLDSVIAFNQPGRRYPITSTLPKGVNFNPQFGTQFRISPDFSNGYTQQANLGLEYKWKGTLFSVVYNYARGVKILAVRNINPIVNPDLGSIRGRLDPTKGNLFEYESSFDSYYNGVTFSANRRLSNRIGFLANYTYSKTIDNFFDFRNPLQEINDPLNIGNERSLSVQDARQRFVFSGIWELSYTKNPILRDFQISSILNLLSGRPWNLLAGADLNRNGDQNDRPPGVARNAGIAPGFASLDMRLTRTIIRKERYRFLITAEVFNLFDKTNVQQFVRTIPRDAQGRFLLPPQENGRYIVTENNFRRAFAPRQVQLGFRVIF